MVLSKLDSSINYNDTMKVEDADKKFELTDILEQVKPKRPMVAYM